MVSVITKDYLLENPDVLEKLKKSVFIYPTDTIYGIGCDARNEELVARVRKIKNRERVPFSIIVPNKEIVKENCDLSPKATEWLKKLPGPYTLILPMTKLFVAKNVSLDRKSIGIRMPDSWFQEVVTDFGFPIITTSVNFHGKPFMTSIKDIDLKIKNLVDYMIDDGNLNGRPSQLINLLVEDDVDAADRF